MDDAEIDALLSQMSDEEAEQLLREMGGGGEQPTDQPGTETLPSRPEGLLGGEMASMSNPNNWSLNPFADNFLESPATSKANLQAKYLKPVDEISSWDILSTNAVDGGKEALESTYDFAKDYYLPTGLGLKMASVAKGPVLRAFGGALGSHIPSFVGDQAEQIVGTEKDTPIMDDLRDEGRGVLRDTGLGLAVSAVAGATEKVGSNFAEKVERKYGNPDEAYTSAFSKDPSELQGGKTSTGSREPLEAVTDALEPILRDPEVAAGQRPFSTLSQRVNSSLNTAKSEIDNSIASMTGQHTFGEVFDPKLYAGRMAPNEAGKVTNLTESILDTERRDFATKILGPDAVRDLDTATRTIGAFKEAESQARVAGRMFSPTWEQKQALAKAESAVESFNAQLNSVPMDAPLMQQKKISYDALRNFSGDAGSKEALTAAVYGDMADNLRNRLYAMEGGERLAAANQNFSDLSRMKPLIDRLAGGEVVPPMSTMKLPSVTAGMRGRPQAYTQLQNLGPAEMTDAQARLRIGTGALTGGQKFEQGAGDVAAGLANVMGRVGAGGAAVASNIGMQGISDYRAPTGQPVITPTIDNAINPQIPVPKEGFQIPRNLSMVDPEGVAKIMSVNIPPIEFAPIMFQWKKITATGDKKEMARMLSAVMQLYPDMPFQHGKVTGLQSEFDIGDGFARLFNDADKAKWESSINNSNLRDDEKAKRVVSLRKDGIAIPLEVKLSTDISRPVPKNDDDVVAGIVSRNNYGPRVQTPLGSRRLAQ